MALRITRVKKHGKWYKVTPSGLERDSKLIKLTTKSIKATGGAINSGATFLWNAIQSYRGKRNPLLDKTQPEGVSVKENSPAYRLNKNLEVIETGTVISIIKGNSNTIIKIPPESLASGEETIIMAGNISVTIKGSETILDSEIYAPEDLFQEALESDEYVQSLLADVDSQLGQIEKSNNFGGEKHATK